MTLFEVTFSVGDTSDTSYLTTTIRAHHLNEAEAMVLAQHGDACVIHSCYPRD